MFIVIDGGDGTGKSTQLAKLTERFTRMGKPVANFRDPGSTQLGEQIRGLLLGDHGIPICDRSEMFLFMAARAEMIEEEIRPALAEEKIVLVDRFLLSTVVYQGYAAGLPVDDIWSMGRIALAGCCPDLTVVLDIAPKTARSRINRPLDRMELKGNEYHNRVRNGFLSAAAEWNLHFPGRCEIVSAKGSPDDVAERIAKLC